MNVANSNTPDSEEPSGLVKWNATVTYRSRDKSTVLVAPTIRSQEARVLNLNTRNIKMRPEETIIINQNIRSIDEISFAYYKEASLKEILENWFTKEEDIWSFYTMSLHENFWRILKRILYGLIWMANPKLSERYSHFRLVATRANIETEEREPMITVFRPGSGSFELTVDHLDKRGDWIRDYYELSRSGEVRYLHSIEHVKYEASKNSGDSRENPMRFYTLIAPEVYDPLKQEE